MSERIAPLLAFVTTKPAARKVSQVDRAEAALWSSPARRASSPSTKPIEKIVQEALSEALDACLSTPNALGVRARELAQELERELRPQQAGRNRA